MGIDRSVSEGKKRWVMSMRTTADGRRRLEEAAEANGRSLTDEIDDRLQRSFQTDDHYGGFRNAAFVNLLGAVIRDVEAKTQKSWWDDQETFAEVRGAILDQLESHAPPQTKRRKTVHFGKNSKAGNPTS